MRHVQVAAAKLPTAAINAPAAISAQAFETLKSGEVARSVLEIGVE